MCKETCKFKCSKVSLLEKEMFYDSFRRLKKYEPQQAGGKQRGRMRILTDTPEKKEMEELESHKAAKLAEKKARQDKKDTKKSKTSQANQSDTNSSEEEMILEGDTDSGSEFDEPTPLTTVLRREDLEESMWVAVEYMGILYPKNPKSGHKVFHKMHGVLKQKFSVAKK